MSASSNHPLRCQCGKVQGHVAVSAAMTHAVCYCKDCQSFAQFLDKSDETLDELGGTDIVPVLPRGIVFTQGRDLLTCVRLSPKGLLRWYTKCCDTPIGNTSANYKFAYVGVVHNCLENSGISLDQSFGPIRMHINSQSASGPVNKKSKGELFALLKLMGAILRERISGAYKQSPFFVASMGQPVATPVILTLEQRQALLRRL